VSWWHTAVDKQDETEIRWICQQLFI
jgi:hypothetical protein